MLAGRCLEQRGGWGRSPGDSRRVGLGAEPQSPPCSLECARCAAAVRACRHLPAAAATAKMPNFAGTWKMRSSENFDELLKALGKLARMACPDGE